MMSQKLIIDCDMGTDDAVALSMALFDPRLEILAITACEGSVNADQSTRNLQAIVEFLDPDKYPRMGAARRCEHAPADNVTFLYGSDGLGNSDFKVSSLQHIPPSEKLIIDCVRAHPGEVTIVCLGPLTNVANALKRDPQIEESINQIVMVGGAIQGIGNITPAAEFNMYFDPFSAQLVFDSHTTKTLVPLDLTSQVEFDLSLLEEIPGDQCRVGCFLKQILPFAFRAYRRELGKECINLNDAVGMLAILRPELFQFVEMAGQVEVNGTLTRGTTVFDRRGLVEWRRNMEVATEIDAEQARQQLINLVNASGACT